MRQRFLIAVGMSLLLIAALMPAAASADGRGRYERGDLKKYPVDERLAKQLRELRNNNRKVMVFVELAGRPVADSIAAKIDAEQTVSEAERESLRRPLREQQASVRRSIERVNGRVHASFTDVLNGFRASVPAGRLGELARASGVRQIHAVEKMYRVNDNSARFLKAAKTWKNPGFTGDGVKIGIIDTGINYYHRDFGGDGQAANDADNPNIVEPGTFPTAKVVGGYDFVGDLYDADVVPDPTPDPDPKDCNGHGTHVAGTAAGMGVRSDGTTFTGPYNPFQLNNTEWNVPPGMAPEASLLAYKIFGCEGGTWVTLDAIEMAVQDGVDVINMSIGSPYGEGGSITDIATNNAVRAGVVVVTSAGNNGPSAYITGSPGTAEGAISVAALDGDPSFPSVWIDMPTGGDIRAINANGETDPLPVTGDLNHFEDNAATPDDESLGCLAADFVYNNFQPGQIAVTHRGVCARIDRAIHGDAAGAAAVIMINNADSFPPYEGRIDGVDIPFLGVPSSAEGRFHTDEGGSATISEAPELANPTFEHVTSFSSGGFRRKDQLLKPDVIAPGQSVISADTNNMTGGVGFSGTSMASPAVAGVAALVVEARPKMSPRRIKGLIVSTATVHNVDPIDLRMVGAGAVNALRATRSMAEITVPNPMDRTDDSFQSSLAFGYEEVVETNLGQALTSKRTFRIWNRSSRSITYNITNQFATPSMGVNVAVSPSRVSVPARSNKLVTVTITMTNAEAAALSDAAPGHGPVLAQDDFGTFHLPLEYVGGRLLLKPTRTRAGVMPLRVPWAVVPRGISNVWPQLGTYSESGGVASTNVKVTNDGVHRGIADFFAFGLQDQREGYDGMDMRAVGVQSLPGAYCYPEAPQDEACLVFAINNWSRFSNASENIWIVPIDTDGLPEDPNEAEYELWGVDAQLILGALEGIFISVVYDVDADEFTFWYVATAPTNSSTILLPAAAGDFGLDNAGDTDFEYWAESYDFWDGGFGEGDPSSPVFHFDVALTGDHPGLGSQEAHYDAWDHPISNGHFVDLQPDTSANVGVSVDRGSYNPDAGHKGWMIVTLDDLTGERQADLLLVGPVQPAPAP